MTWVQFATNEGTQQTRRARVAIGTMYPTHQIGGTEVLVRILAIGLAGSFDVILVSPESHERLDVTLQRSIFGHIELPGNSIQCSPARLATVLRAHQVRLMHFHVGGLYGWRMGYFHLCPIPRLIGSGISVALTTHGLLDAPPNVALNRPRLIRKALQRYAWASRVAVSELSRADIFVSHHNLSVARRRAFPAGRKMDCIYHSQLPDVCFPLLPKRKTILCVATIVETKGQLVLLEAFSKIADRFADWNLEYVGRTHSRRYVEALKKFARASGLETRVAFHNGMDFEALTEFYTKASIFVLPSLYEGLGLTLQEAMFFGCAAIGSDVGGIPELITHNSTGLLASPSDPEALATALAILLGSPATRDRFAQAGQEMLRQRGMSASNMIRRYTDLYRGWLATR